MMSVRREIGSCDFFPANFVDGLDALVLTKRVEGPVPADGEKPRLELRLDLRNVLLAEPDEDVLHHITGEIGIMEECGGITEKWRFVVDQGLLDE
jgi:hypothetical protein